MPQVMEAAEEQSKLEAQQLHEMLAVVPHEVSVCEGEVWPLISDMVAKQKIDLIVIGTSGRTGITRALLGSVAEEIFRRASCPVLTVGPQVSRDVERRLEMKEILYATDFSPESLAALPYAVSLAQEHQARLTLLHVVGESKTYLHLYGASRGELMHEEQYADSIRRQLRELMPPEAEPWCEPKYMVQHGPEADKIMEAATALGADLIVLGVRGAEGGMAAATHLARPIAHRVVTQARCPVLTVRG
jgi:nucleotide-binding universal stress UspA family protein